MDPSNTVRDLTITRYRNVDENPNTARQFGVMSIPTLIVKKDGEVVNKVIGYHSKEQLEELLEQYL